MIFKISSAFLLALSSAFSSDFATVTAQDNDNGILIGQDQDEGSILMENMVDRCVIDFDSDAGIDYFPTKYAKPTIASYGDIDIFGDKFVPHNTTDFLEITYHKTYKIVTNKHQDPPKSYLLYQCGTEIPQDVIDDPNNDFDLVVPVPHQGGLALTQTPQIPYVELLGLREDVIAYIGNPVYVTSPCMSHMLGENATAGLGTSIETIYDSDSTIQEELIADFRERHPDALIVSGPTNNIVGDQVIVASSTQERTNVATFDWVAFYSVFFNMEGESNRITTDMQESYDCSSDVAKNIAAQQRQLPATNREVALEDGAAVEGTTDDKDDYKEPVIMWANYFTYQDLGWSVAECPTWDTTYYCEYAKHCGASVLSRPEGVGYNKTWGSPTVYWYLNDEEVLAMGKDADVFIYSGADWDSIYALKNETLDQFKSVQNKQVFDTLGQGPSAWNEQRYAEYDVVGLDMCDVVGHASATGPKHERRWFRNVYTEPIGSMDVCDVAGGEITRPYVPPGQECVRPQETLPLPDDETTSAASSSSSLVGLSFAMVVAATYTAIV